VTDYKKLARRVPRPTDLPPDKKQCSHLTVQHPPFDSSRVVPPTAIRCADRCVPLGRHGWLCPNHYDAQKEPLRRLVGRLNEEQLEEYVDAERVTLLIGTDRRAIQRGTVIEVARLTQTGERLRVLVARN
jgi:hypothetical protein